MTVRRAPAAWIPRRLLAAQQREREHILREMSRIRGLLPLLMQVRNGGGWTRAEREALLTQLRGIARLSPYIVVLLLPGSFVALPALAWWLDRRRQRRELPPPRN